MANTGFYTGQGSGVQTVTIKITGLKELEDRLKKLSDKIARRVGNNALRAGARIIEKAAKGKLSNTNIGSWTRVYKKDFGKLKSGHVTKTEGGRVYKRTHLRDSITSSVAKVRPAAGTITYWVYPNRAKGGWYGHMVELGTKAHRIPKSGDMTLRIGNNIFTGHIDHPGAKARPFLRPAFDENRQRVADKIAEILRAGIERNE